MDVVKKAGTVVGGLRGRVQVGDYAVAADVHGFTVERDEHGALFLRASVGQFSEYRLGQSPLWFIVTVKSGEWKWPIVDVLSFVDHAMFARLGPAVAQQGRPVPL